MAAATNYLKTRIVKLREFNRQTRFYLYGIKTGLRNTRQQIILAGYELQKTKIKIEEAKRGIARLRKRISNAGKLMR